MTDPRSPVRPSSSERRLLSLLPTCRGCAFRCCARGASPIVLPDDRDRIVREDGRDYFVPLTGGDGYYIGRRPDGTARDLLADPCPYLATDGRCSIQEIKPVDCVVYPFKPTYSRSTGTPLWALDVRCPAAADLGDEYVATAKRLGTVLVQEVPQGVYEMYERAINSWPTTAPTGEPIKVESPAGQSESPPT